MYGRNDPHSIQIAYPWVLAGRGDHTETYRLTAWNHYHAFEVDVQFDLGEARQVLRVRSFSPYFAASFDGHPRLDPTEAYRRFYSPVQEVGPRRRYPEMLIELG